MWTGRQVPVARVGPLHVLCEATAGQQACSAASFRSVAMLSATFSAP
jgi:hypothetical protein